MSVGDQVVRVDKLAVLEAMKMQHEIVADLDGVVGQLHAAAGDDLAVNDLILQIDVTPAE